MTRSKSPAPPLPMRPQGAAGRAFGVLMEALNGPAYAYALNLLAVEPASDVLEIGFGTGRMLELMLAATSGRICGVDPTPTMLAVARKRPALRRARARVDLRLGGDADLGWPSASFDRIVALHSFQFWPEPAATAPRLFTLLRPGGRLVLVLRLHRGGGASDWLPNPLSRGPDEQSAAARLFEAAGFRVERDGKAGLIAHR